MTDQPDLWTPQPPVRRKRHKTADTSVAGLDRVRPVRGHQQQIVLETLRAYGRLTRHQVAELCALPLSSICARVNELVKAGEVREVVTDGRKLVIDGRHVVEVVIQHTLARSA